MSEVKGRNNVLDGTTWEFNRVGFWVLHAAVAGAAIWLIVRVLTLR